METLSPNPSISPSKSNQPSFRADVRTGATPRQLEVLVAIAASVKKHGYAPIFTEIAPMIGVTSKASVAAAIARLEKRGLVTRTARTSRSLNITRDGHRVLRNFYRREAR